MGPPTLITIGTSLLWIISEVMALSKQNKYNSISEFLFCAVEVLKNRNKNTNDESEGTAVVTEDKD